MRFKIVRLITIRNESKLTISTNNKIELVFFKYEKFEIFVEATKMTLIKDFG